MKNLEISAFATIDPSDLVTATGGHGGQDHSGGGAASGPATSQQPPGGRAAFGRNVGPGAGFGGRADFGGVAAGLLPAVGQAFASGGGDRGAAGPNPGAAFAGNNSMPSGAAGNTCLNMG